MSLAKYLRHINADTILTPVADESVRKIHWGSLRPGDWPLLTTEITPGNRYSQLQNKSTPRTYPRLKAEVDFPDFLHFGLETTPLSDVGDALYVTGPHEVFALDASTGAADLGIISRPADQWL